MRWYIDEIFTIKSNVWGDKKWSLGDPMVIIFSPCHTYPPKVLCAVYFYAVSQTKMVYGPHKIKTTTQRWVVYDFVKVVSQMNVYHLSQI